MTGKTLAEFLAQPHVGVLASLRRSGLPYTVPVWWLWDGEGFWLTGTTARVWCRQLIADPRASLCIEALTPVAGHVGVDGEVTVHRVDEQPDFWTVHRRLVEKYVPPEAVEAFFANIQTEPRILFRLTPEDRPNAIRAIDMRVYRGKREDRRHQEATRG